MQRLVGPLGAAELAGLLRGWFEENRRACDLEREDRWNVMPGPNVEPEVRAAFDGDNVEDAYDVLDLDDVWKGRGDAQEDGPCSSSVGFVDPFHDR